ncbi:MAG: PilC/PilY family type IV pilus protein [Immundisolibacteraceae bacterium]|nr:PilC/PilY family type IV pilus protein [Immundisolibacteraceae bacterium]
MKIATLNHLSTVKIFLLSFCCVFIYANAVLADDTDIYLGDPDANVIRPNILFVLDTSDSMNKEVVGTGKSRLENMRDAMTQLVQDLDNVNIGLMRFNGRRHGDNDTPTGGAVILPISNLDDPLSVLPSEASPTSFSITVPVNSPNDDAEESAVDGSVVLNSTTLELAQTSSTEITLQIPIINNKDDARANLTTGSATSLNTLEVKRDTKGMGLRFQNVAVPTDATITTAKIRFTAKNQDGGNVIATIRGEATPAPAQFNTSDDMTTRPLTTASASWIPEKFFAEKEYFTTDISDVIAELTSAAAGWVNGNTLALFIFDEAGNSSKKRRPYDFSSDPAKAAVLEITYLDPAAIPEEQIVGLRFQDVGVPQGATIVSAELDFIAEDPLFNSATTDVVLIEIEDADDAAPFDAQINSISNRNWEKPHLWVIDDSPDPAKNDLVTASPVYGPSPFPNLDANLKDQLQHVVDRAGWCGGNAMAFQFRRSIFSAAGVKTFKSADAPIDASNPPGAPVLRVVYDQSNLPAGTGCIRKTLTFQPEHNKDDGFEVIDTSAMQLSGRLKTGTTDDTNGSNTIIGLRFPGVNLLPTTSIISAQLEVTTKQSGTGNTTLTISGLDLGNTPRLETNELLSDTVAKPRTSAQSNWVITDDSFPDETLISPDIASILTEVTQDPGNNWIVGNALGLFLENGTNSRSFYSFNNNPALAPRLKVVVETNATDSITVRDKMLQLINEQTHTLNRTPSVETLYEAALYWRGDDVYYGTHRGQGNFPNGVPNPNDFNPFHVNDNDQDGSPAPDLTGMRFGRVSHPDSYTGGTLNQPAGCTAENLNAVECHAEVIDGTPTYISPFDIAECQSNYMIFLSDGAPTQNNEAPSLIQTLTGDTSCEDNPLFIKGACGENILDYLATTDQSDLDGDQTVTTYTIGFNIGDAGNENTVEFMQDLATAGRGQFKTADTASELSDQLLAIFTDIFSDPTSFAAPALQVNAFNKLQHRNEVYFSLFEPAKETRWDGNVKKYKVCDGNGCTLGEVLDATDAAAINSSGVIADSAQSFWSSVVDGPTIEAGGAGAVVPDPLFRNVYTYTGAATPVNVDLGDSAHEISVANKANLDTLLGFADGSIDPELDALIEWIRGVDSFDEDADGDITDNRWPIADPLHGSPVALTYGCTGGVPGTPCVDTGDNAIIKVFVTGNDGSIRMLNGNNGTSGGEEEWVFYPQQMLAEQAALAANAEGDHGYGVDNTPTVIQFDKNGDAMIDPLTGEYVRLFFSMRRGGDSIFALDVTPDSTVLTDTDSTTGLTPSYLWRIDGSSTKFPNLGQTWSRPKPAVVRVPKSGGGSGDSELKTVLIFAGGYDTAQDGGFGKSNTGNAIYIVDADTGERIWWASNDEVLDGNGDSPNLVLTDMDYPIPSDIALLDASGDGAINRLYVGDMGGQVWRIDLDDQLGGPQTGPADGRDDSSGARLAVLSNPDSNSANVEDHRKFFYPPDVVQVEDAIFSNEASYDLVAIVSGDRANPLEADVLNRAYGLRDYAVGDALVEGGQVPLRHSGYDIGDGTIDGDADGDSEKDLFDTTENLIQVGNSSEQSLAKSAMQASSGWFVDLTDNGTKVGEKGLSSPIILAGKLFFTTFLPSTTNDPCLAIEGSGRLYGINAITAAAEFEDWLEGGDDNDFETGDRTYALGGGIPSSAVPIFQEQGVTLLIGTGGGAESVDPDIALPRVRTYWYQEQ